MNTAQGKPQKVVVAGDITVNWNLARTQEAAASREAVVAGRARGAYVLEINAEPTTLRDLADGASWPQPQGGK